MRLRPTAHPVLSLLAAMALATAGCSAGAFPTLGDLASAPQGASGRAIGFGGNVSTASASTAPAARPAEATAAGGPGSSSSRPGTAVSEVGLGSFFDTYNFNFPIPPNQALGAVANLSQALVGPEGGKLFVQIGLQTVERPAATRQPLNVSLVFDRSGSMDGEKIEYSRVAARRMVEEMGEGDRFSLVPFDTGAETLIAPTFVINKPALFSKIEGLDPAGSTNIDEGLSYGYRHVRTNLKSEQINRVILMSDGEANVGETSQEVLGRRASSAAAEGISLSTIGVGTGFNEGFMTHLATQGKGSFYFVNSQQDALNAFVGEIKALQRIVAKGVKLDIRLADGVKLVQVYGHTGQTQGQSLNVDSNDLITGQSKVILLELDVPAGAAGAKRKLVDVSCDFEDVPFGGRKTASASAEVEYSSEANRIAGSRNSQIASSVLVLQTASKLIVAADQLDQGNATGARETLEAQLRVVEAKAKELDDADLRDEVLNLTQYLGRLDAKADAEVLKKDLQFDAFQKQQGKKKTLAPASTAPGASPSASPSAAPSVAPSASPGASASPQAAG